MFMGVCGCILGWTKKKFFLSDHGRTLIFMFFGL